MPSGGNQQSWCTGYWQLGLASLSYWAAMLAIGSWANTITLHSLSGLLEPWLPWLPSGCLLGASLEPPESLLGVLGASWEPLGSLLGAFCVPYWVPPGDIET